MSPFSGKHYLDHAGSAVFTESQLAQAMTLLLKTDVMNPHSALSDQSSDVDDIEEARKTTLAFCNAPFGEYHCIFTSGATSALALLANGFPWTSGHSCFVHTVANHTSVLAMRDVAASHGAHVRPVVLHTDSQKSSALPADPAQPVCGSLSAIAVEQRQRTDQPSSLKDGHHAQRASGRATVGHRGSGDAVHHLIALPAECNLTGVRCPSETVQRLLSCDVELPLPDHEAPQNVLVLLDAAKVSQTAPPDLTATPVHFAVLSFYKIFGYPTGLGALLVRKDCLSLLRPPFLGGGTVKRTLPASWPTETVPRSGVAAFEPGTSNFLAIRALEAGFQAWRQWRHGREAWPQQLALGLCEQLRALTHSNGRPVCQVYAWRRAEEPREGSCEGSLGGVVGIGELASDAQAAASTASAESDVRVSAQGPVVAFNVFDRDGRPVGCSSVHQALSAHGIVVRSGCCCNPGACAAVLGLSDADLHRHHASGWTCGGQHSVIDGQHSGVVRASFGYSSREADVTTAVAALRSTFVDLSLAVRSSSQRVPMEAAETRGATGGKEAKLAQVEAGDHAAAEPSASASPTASSAGLPQSAAGASRLQALESEAVSQRAGPLPAQSDEAHTASTSAEHSTPPRASAHSGRHDGRDIPNADDDDDDDGRTVLQAMFVYPVKSCRGARVRRWPMTATGLYLDRSFMVVDAAACAITCRRVPTMLRVCPAVDLEAGTMTLRWIRDPSPATSATSSFDDDLCVVHLVAPRADTHDARNASRRGSSESCGDLRPPSSGPHAATHAHLGDGMMEVQVNGARRSAQMVQTATTRAGKGACVHEWLTERLARRCYLVQLEQTSEGPPPLAADFARGRGPVGNLRLPEVPREAVWLSDGMPARVQRETSGATNRCSPAAGRGRAASFANAGAVLIAGTGSTRVFLEKQAQVCGIASSSKRAYPQLQPDKNTAGSSDDAAMDSAAQRFRVNLLFSCTAHAEDQWRVIELGQELAIGVTSAAVRCSAVSCNWETGARDPWNPLKVLTQYRSGVEGITWGMYAQPFL